MYTILSVVFFIAVVCVLGSVTYLLRKRITCKISSDAQIIAKILNVQDKQSPFGLEKTVEGYYKERKIVYRYKFWTRYSNKTSLYIVPQIVPKKQKMFRLFSYPKPTEHTRLEDKLIAYEIPFSAEFSGLNKTGSEKEIIDIFEELTRAAEVVESNQHYYRE